MIFKSDTAQHAIIQAKNVYQLLLTRGMDQSYTHKQEECPFPFHFLWKSFLSTATARQAETETRFLVCGFISYMVFLYVSK